MAEYNGESEVLGSISRIEELEYALTEVIDAYDQDTLFCSDDESEEIIERARRVRDRELEIEVELED